MSNIEIIEKIHEMLKEFHIKPGKITKRKATRKWNAFYQFGIFGQNDLKLFASEIGFDHFQKKMYLSEFIQKYENKKFKHKKGEMKYLILNALGNKKTLSPKEIANILNKELDRKFYKHLEKLEKDDIVKSIKQGNIKLYAKKENEVLI